MCKVWKSVWTVWMSLLLKESHRWFAAWFLLVLVREPLASWPFTEAACRLWEKKAATDLVAFCQLIHFQSTGSPSRLVEDWTRRDIGVYCLANQACLNSGQNTFVPFFFGAWNVLLAICRSVPNGRRCFESVKYQGTSWSIFDVGSYCTIIVCSNLGFLKSTISIQLIALAFLDNLSIKVCLCQRLPRALQCHSCIAYAAHRHWSLGGIESRGMIPKVPCKTGEIRFRCCNSTSWKNWMRCQPRLLFSMKYFCFNF